MNRKYETKSDEKTHRFMDRNKPKGLRKNSNRAKLERKKSTKKGYVASLNRKKRKHGRSV